jgi:hypothetical protein
MPQKPPLLEPFSYIRFGGKFAAHLLLFLGSWATLAEFFKPLSDLKDYVYANPQVFVIMMISYVPFLLAIEMLQRCERGRLESMRANPLRPRQLDKARRAQGRKKP